MIKSPSLESYNAFGSSATVLRSILVVIGDLVSRAGSGGQRFDPVLHVTGVIRNPCRFLIAHLCALQLLGHT